MAQPIPAILETILVVEDNPLVLEFLTVCLEKAGFDILAVGSPEEARRVEVEHSGPIRLLIADAIMLHTSGPDLATELKARRPGMPVVLISGWADDARVIEYEGRFLEKPFNANALLDMVNDALYGKAPALSNRTAAAGAHQ